MCHIWFKQTRASRHAAQSTPTDGSLRTLTGLCMLPERVEPTRPTGRFRPAQRTKDSPRSIARGIGSRAAQSRGRTVATAL